MPVREIKDFCDREEAPEIPAMATDEGGADAPNLQGSYPARFRNLSLIDSTRLAAAAEKDKDILQGYLAMLGAPNQLFRLAVCCNEASESLATRG